MADTKISALTADATPTTDDLLVIVNDPGGTPVNRKVTIGQVEAIVDVLNMVNAPAEANADVTDATNVATAGALMDADFGSNGIMVRTASATYGIITDSSSNWDTAHGWGDHASAGYLLNVVEDTTPQLGGMLDVNTFGFGDGTLELLSFSETVSAVNEVTIANAATGNGPAISATGDDLNIDLNLTPKGTGVVNAGGSRVLTTADEGTGNGIDADTLDGAEGAAYALLSTLALTSNGNGASLIGIEDAAGDITATTVEGALAENRAAIDVIEAAGYITDVLSDTSPQLGGMLDVNGNAIGDGTLELLTFTETGSAVNHVNITNATTTAGPTVGAVGDDANIDLNLVGKGTGVVNVSGSRVLTTADEGTGNGLDADTLDGIEGSALVPTSRQVIAGDGLSDGGALTGDVTLNVDIFGQTGDASPASTDILMVEATAGGSFRKVALSDLPGGGGSVSALSDTTITGPTSGDLLKWNGSAWVDESLSEIGILGNVSEDTTPQLGAMLDVNTFGLGDGTLELLTFTETASAVNHINVTNATTTAAPILGAAGDDANIDLKLAGKGTGNVLIGANRVLTVGDEGTGNGLDADTVDGVEASAFATLATLASAANGDGASLVALEDVGTLFATDNVEAALAEVMGDVNTLETNNTGTNTGDQTITLTGDVTGTGTGSFATTIAAKAVDVAMLADGTDGELITWSATGVAATVLTGSSGEVLTSNGVGTAPTFQAAAGGGDVTAGTQSANQVAYWNATAKQIEGSTAFTFDGATLSVTAGIAMTDGQGDQFLADRGNSGAPGLSLAVDPDTGFYYEGDDHFGLAVGAISGYAWLETSSHIVQSVETHSGLTASVTQTQGNGALLSSYNVISTVGTTNDVVTLVTADTGDRCTVVNDAAANTLQIFPASGDDLGQGLNTSTTLAAGASVTFLAVDATNWVLENNYSASGGGDALVANPLSQFAATTSAQLASTISDETGTGLVVFGTDPAITTPTLILKDANGAAPTTDGEIKYDRTGENLEVGDGAATNIFSHDAGTATLTNKTINDFSNKVDADALHLQVRNESGGTLTAGTPVYASGFSVGQSLVLVSAADASTSATMPCLGIIETDILNNATGAVVESGRLANVDTSSWSVGDVLYVSETAGTLTSTPPTGAALVQEVGEVLRSNATLGVIEINLEAVPYVTGLAFTLLDDGTQAAMQTTLGLVPGTDVQAYDADLTTWAGITPGANVGTFLATPSSANLASAVTDETGSGSLVFGTSPTLVTPVLGTPASGTLTSCTGLPVSGIVDSTSLALGLGSIELGHASDTTIARDAAGLISVEGTKVKLAGKETIWVPASAMTARTTTGAASGSAETTTNKVMVETFDFDTAADEHVQFSIAFPKSWNLGTVTAQFFWSNASGTGTVSFAIQGMALADSDVLDTAFGTAVVTTDTMITAGDLHVSDPSTAVTIAGTPGDDELVYFQVYRDVSADTLGVDARLHGVKLIYTTDAANDD